MLLLLYSLAYACMAGCIISMPLLFMHEPASDSPLYAPLPLPPSCVAVPLPYGYGMPAMRLYVYAS